MEVCAQGVVLKMRPISPHLQIYKLQMTSFLSLTNRLSEICVFLGALAWSAFLLLDYTLPYWLYDWPGKWLAWCVLMVFSYHLLGIVRHTVLDFGLGFSVPSIYVFGWLLLAFWGALGALFYGCLL